MVSVKLRILLFLLLCIPIRSLFVYIVYKNPKYLRFFSVFYLIMGIGFLNQFIKNKRIGFFGGKVWWNNLRLLNFIFYTLFAISAFYKNKKSYLLLIPDIVIGMILFIFKYTHCF